MNFKKRKNSDNFQERKSNKKPFKGQNQAFTPNNHGRRINKRHSVAMDFTPNKKYNNEDSPHTYTPSTSFSFSESNVKKLIVKPGVKWFENLASDPTPTVVHPVSLVTSIRSEAQQLHKEDVSHYQKFLEKRKEKSDFAWIKTILRTGTLSDKISAHTLLIQDSPVHNLNSIENLISMVNLKGKRECLMAMDCLKELFLSDLLLPEKKLKSFPQHPLHELDALTSGNIATRKKKLLLWFFQDELKNLYFKFITNLELVSKDTVEKTKQKSISVMYELLRDNPEQQQFLLEHLVNKIGDPIPKVGSHVCYLLGQLVTHHPMMIAVVVKEVERVLFRLNIAERAKYYCLCFLNQLILDHEGSNIANHLITMYFGLFKLYVKKGEVDTKMMSALLSGVARAYPYAKLKNDIVMEQLDAMFRLVHMVNFNISVQALMLIFQVLNSKDSVSDRFYSALYRKIIDPAFSSSSRQSMLLNLLFKALKKDVASVRVKAFVKRLLQIGLYQSSNLQCGILMLISELSKIHLNLLDSKRFVEFSDSDSDEHFEDVEEGDAGSVAKTSMKPSNADASSWVHRQNKGSKKGLGYDVNGRNPQHTGAEFSKLWELFLLKKSYHPSTSLFGHQVSISKQINYTGDPLADFTLIRFLDRFVYRNPKKVSESAKANVHRKVFGRKLPTNIELKPMDIMSAAYTQQNENKVSVDEKFIYQYLRQRSLTGRSRKDSDVESVGSDEFDEFLDNMHADDEGKDTVDFARELSDYKCKNKNKNALDDAEADLSDLGEDESDLEDELNFEDDDDFDSAFKEFDEDLETFPVDEEDMDEDTLVENGRTKRKSKKLKENGDDVFLAADEFDTLLESNVNVDKSAFSSNAFVNTDRSDAKQLAWERERDQYVRGTDWKSRRNKSRKMHTQKGKFFRKKKRT